MFEDFLDSSLRKATQSLVKLPGNIDTHSQLLNSVQQLMVLFLCRWKPVGLHLFTSQRLIEDPSFGVAIVICLIWLVHSVWPSPLGWILEVKWSPMSNAFPRDQKKWGMTLEPWSEVTWLGTPCWIQRAFLLLITVGIQEMCSEQYVTAPCLVLFLTIYIS